MKFTVFDVEEVYDAFDVYEHSNALVPVVVEADSSEDAKPAGANALWDDIQKMRQGFLSSGTFVPLVTQIIDDNGLLVYDDRERMLRGWSFPSDERETGELASSSTVARMACFVSYNSKGTDFATLLFSELLKGGVLCWYVPRRPEMPKKDRAEDRILRDRLAEAISAVRVDLIIVSNHSLKSDWVHFEVSKALEHHNAARAPKLIGLKIGEPDIAPAWLSSLVDNHPIWDFADWQNHELFRQQVKRLGKQIVAMFQTSVTS